MKFNNNFNNEFYIWIPKQNRSKALSLLKKISDNIPGAMHKANMKVKDELEGSTTISMNNTRAIPEQTLAIIKKYLYSLRKLPDYDVDL